MTTSTASVLGVIYVLSELGLAFKKRAKAAGSRIADRGSLSLLWVVIVASVVSAFNLAIVLPEAGMTAASTSVLDAAGIGLFAAGLALRWYAIVHLGRFFTVNVAIAADHRLNDTGPYRFVRHPSYTGALMAFLGIGLCLGNWASLAVIVVPVALAFLRRMRIEEAALLQAFGNEYRSYMNRTKRLIPAVY
jgi:protein-S-isoprenylcysteine O-methyltransferase